MIASCTDTTAELRFTDACSRIIFTLNESKTGYFLDLRKMLMWKFWKIRIFFFLASLFVFIWSFLLNSCDKLLEHVFSSSVHLRIFSVDWLRVWSAIEGIFWLHFYFRPTKSTNTITAVRAGRIGYMLIKYRFTQSRANYIGFDANQTKMKSTLCFSWRRQSNRHAMTDCGLSLQNVNESNRLFLFIWWKIHFDRLAKTQKARERIQLWMCVRK